jgi:gamma-glutamyl hydrolase
MAVNEHSYGLSSDAVNKNSYLKKDIRILSTNFDRNGVEFVSSFEMKSRAVYATQYHPEKNAFNWNVVNATHSFDSIQAMQVIIIF